MITPDVHPKTLPGETGSLLQAGLEVCAIATALPDQRVETG